MENRRLLGGFCMFGIYTNFEDFQAKAQSMGVQDDLKALLSLDVLFFERYDDYTLLSIKDHSEAPKNILILSRKNNILFSEKKITQRDFRLFRSIVAKSHGESTALTLLVLKEVLRSYTRHFDALNQQIDSYSSAKDLDKIEQTTVDLRKLTVDVEDFQNLLYSLDDRKVREFRSEYISYDFDLLLARAQHLLDRCRNHLQELRDLRSEVEVRATAELNYSIKRLTGFTVLFMVPTLVSSFYGMNFVFMPELAHPLGYPAVIAFMAAATLATALWMRRKGWL